MNNSGEIKGTIEYVNVRGDNYFTLYTWCGPEIRCYFKDEQLPEVLASMTGKPFPQMIVRGILRKTEKLGIDSIYVESIQKAE